MYEPEAGNTLDQIAQQSEMRARVIIGQQQERRLPNEHCERCRRWKRAQHISLASLEYYHAANRRTLCEGRVHVNPMPLVLPIDERLPLAQLWKPRRELDAHT